jgi:hypothetical protein
MNPKVREILEALGWIHATSKNPYMESFIKEDMRLNYYFTTGSTTVQSESKGLIKNEKNITTPEQMEEIICTIN